MPRYITLMRFAFLTGLSDRPDLLYAWIERRPADANLRYATPGGYAEAAKRIEEAKRGRFNRVNRPFLNPGADETPQRLSMKVSYSRSSSAVVRRYSPTSTQTSSDRVKP